MPDAAANGDTVLVLDGMYTGLGNKDLDYAGKPITVRSENGPEGCIVDCENDGRGLRFQSAEAAGSVLQGLTIRRADAYEGGVIYCYQGSPTIRRCQIVDNTVSAAGGGVLCYDNSAPLIEACLFSGNTASDGGAIAWAAH